MANTTHMEPMSMVRMDSEADSESGSIRDVSEAKLLHLAGSVESQFLFDLSLLYCKTSWEALTQEFSDSWLAVVTPDRQWYLTQTFENATETSEPMSQEVALDRLAGLGIDVVVPHMFCQEGMTVYRDLMENAGFIVLGNSGEVCAVANHKHQTKEVLSKAGVRCPQGAFIHSISEAPEDFPLPCVVKPCDLDNSVGVSYCETAEEYRAALELVFTLTNDVLVEEYIPGEEMRCGIIEQKDGPLKALPIIRYILDVPIRGTAQKLILNEDKEIQGYATKPSQTELPAQISEESRLRIEAVAKAAHEALGCRYYSLFDFRVNDEEVVLLEACLFCSFSPKSVLPTLARVENIGACEFFRSMLEVAFSKK